ncbi:MAG: hypothetical protein GXP17_09515 [Gammaproteobacteria bacterium]|nr:hypothetical protein [Gammaproteobacteria bacterium]
MDSPDPTAVIILLELVFFETIAIIGLLAYLLVKKRKRAKLLAEQFAAIKEALSTRQVTLTKTFEGIPKLTKEQLDTATQAMAEHELAFYKYLIDGWHQPRNEPITQMQEAVSELLSPYAQLTPAPVASAPTAEPEKDDALVPDVDDAIDALLADPPPEQKADPVTEADPAFDLSEDGEPEIAEIPDDLLGDEDFSGNGENSSPAEPKKQETEK